MSKALISSNAQGSGMKNRIINGGMDISQRGTSFAGNQNGYVLDRFRITSGGPTAAFLTVTQNSDVPSNNEFQNSLRCAVTTADTSIAAVDVLILEQLIEGYNIRDLIGRTFTLSFWVRSSKTGIHCVSFSNSISDRSYIAEYTIIASNTWEYKTITVTGGLITAGTWNYTNGLGLRVEYSLAGGTTWQTTAGSWQTGNFTNTSNQVNCLDTIGNIFAITGVQLEVGSVATPFEHRQFGTELALCQRYYYVYSGGSADFQENCTRGATTTASATVCLPVTMRTTPSVSTTVTNPFFRGIFYDTSFGITQSNITAISIGASRTNDCLQLFLTHGAVAGTSMYMSIDSAGIGGLIGITAEI